VNSLHDCDFQLIFVAYFRGFQGTSELSASNFGWVNLGLVGYGYGTSLSGKMCWAKKSERVKEAMALAHLKCHPLNY